MVIIIHDLKKCKWCHCMTKTRKIKSLSASENVHYRYECCKCGFKRD